MVDHFRQTLLNEDLTHKHHVAYFYCLHDDKETLNTVVILKSILKQLVASLPDFPDEITMKFDNDKRFGELGELSLSTIKDFLTATIKQASLPLFILIDGIDECNMQTRADLLKHLIPLTSESNSGPSNIVKICLFSRPYHDIRDRLALLLHSKKLLQIPIRKEDTTYDMRAFLKCAIAADCLLDKFLKENEELRDQIIEVLVTKADGMSVFLFWCVQCNTNQLEF